MPFHQLEDLAGDVLAKAMAGRGLGYRELAARVGISPEALRPIREHRLDDSLVSAVATELGLKEPALRAALAGDWLPHDTLPPGIRRHTTTFGDLSVNAYSCRLGGATLVVDTGTDARPLIGDLGQTHPDAILITHTHRDHIAALADLRNAYPGTPVLAPAAEPLPGAMPFDPGGAPLRFGSLTVRLLPTHGHSPGGTSFFLEAEGICFCGDALFAGSVGGCAGDYGPALARIRHHLLSLPGATVLLPGHGPATTVAGERAMNPFFPDLGHEDA